MRRAILVGAGTVAGAAAVLAYQPGAMFSASAGQAKAATAAPAAATTPSAQTFTGDAVETGYGPVQVEVTIEGSTITDVTAVAAPENDGKSAQISAYVIPRLQEQAVAAQSARIDGISGASYTSAGFAQSLQSALAKAGMA